MGGLKYDRDWCNPTAAHNTPAKNLEEKPSQFTLDRNLQSQRINNSKILPQSNKKPTFYFFFLLFFSSKWHFTKYAHIHLHYKNTSRSSENFPK